jgi:hypothetical protein
VIGIRIGIEGIGGTAEKIWSIRYCTIIISVFMKMVEAIDIAHAAGCDYGKEATTVLT